MVFFANNPSDNKNHNYCCTTEMTVQKEQSLIVLSV